MRDVLIDLHKTDALIQMSGLQYGHEEAQNILYAQVMEKHGITQAQFDSSLVWYTAHPVLFDKIYPKVQARLKAEHKAFQEAHEEELNLKPATIEGSRKPGRKFITEAQLDSMLWVTRHGYPNSWNEWEPKSKEPFIMKGAILDKKNKENKEKKENASVHNTEDKLLPKVSVPRRGVVDTLKTGIRFSQVSDN